LGVIFMRGGIAEVGEHAIAEMLGDKPSVTLNHGVAGLVILLHHTVVVFGIELGGECGRPHEVTEHHGQLPPLAFGPSRVCLSFGLRVSGRGGWSEFCFPVSPFSRFPLSCPDEHLAVFIYRQPLGINQFDFEVVEVFIVKSEPSPQGSVRNPLLALKQFEHLGQGFVKGHA
jgi:hypothetical protein